MFFYLLRLGVVCEVCIVMYTCLLPGLIHLIDLCR